MVGQVELAFRVAAALVLSVTPTLFFLGLYRVLAFLRDEELIARVRSQDSLGSSPTPAETAASILPDTGSDSANTCEDCGTPNLPAVTYCQQCLCELPEE